MKIDRRGMIGGAFSLASAVTLLGVRSLRAELVVGADATAALQRAIDAATRAGRPTIMPPGLFNTATLRLPDGAPLIGSSGMTRLMLRGDGPLIAADKSARIMLSGIAFDGAD